jgi:hypothetical protein
LNKPLTGLNVSYSYCSGTSEQFPDHIINEITFSPHVYQPAFLTSIRDLRSLPGNLKPTNLVSGYLTTSDAILALMKRITCLLPPKCLNGRVDFLEEGGHGTLIHVNFSLSFWRPPVGNLPDSPTVFPVSFEDSRDIPVRKRQQVDTIHFFLAV